VNKKGSQTCWNHYTFW